MLTFTQFGVSQPTIHVLARNAVMNVCKYAFESLKLQRLEAVTFENNKRSINLLKKIGFKHEGITRESSLTVHGFQNDYVFSILSHEYCKN